MELAGKTALVTGASSGVGRAIATAFAEAGMHVFGTSRNPDQVEWPDGVVALQLDASMPEAVTVFWNDGGFASSPPDIVVNNAGAGRCDAFCDVEFAGWESQIALMLFAPMRLSHLAMGAWKRVGRKGALVNVSSLAVEYAIPYMCGYNVAKAGLAAFSESVSLESGKDSVQMLELRLGDLNTGFSSRLAAIPKDERAKQVASVLRKREQAGPDPSIVAKKLLEALAQDRTGMLRVGSFFQTVIASLFARIVSHRVRRAVNLSYYSLGKD